jgi:hypothetical protein
MIAILQVRFLREPAMKAYFPRPYRGSKQEKKKRKKEKKKNLRLLACIILTFAKRR